MQGASKALQRGVRAFSLGHTQRYASSSTPSTSIATLLASPSDNAEKQVFGFIRSIRKQKTRAFASIGDGTSLEPLQALLSPSQAQNLTAGSAVCLAGQWVPSPSKNQAHELHVRDVSLLGTADPETFPLQKKYQSPEYLRTIPHIRPRLPFNSLMLRFRSQSIAELTTFFAQREFIQTHTPIITSSDCEGAGEVFRIGDNAPIKESQGRQGEGDGGFFRSPKYMTVSSQLHLEALAQAVGKVWTLSPAFRAEKSDTNRHLSEFYMLEAEVNFEDKLEGIMTLVEDMLRHMTTKIWHSKLGQEIIHGNKTGVNSVGYDTSEEAIQILSELRPRWQGMMKKGWPRITYSDAIKAMQRSSWNFTVPPTWDGGLQAEHETWLTMFIGDGKPLFVTHYPQKIKAFYMLPSHTSEVANSDPGPTVDCFDLLVPQALEIAGGSMREYRLPELLSAMHAHGILPTAIDASAVSDGTADEALGCMKWYVDLRRWGSVPHGGFGLGFDRLLGYLAGVPNIREVVAFPRWAGRCDC